MTISDKERDDLIARIIGSAKGHEKLAESMVEYIRQRRQGPTLEDRLRSVYLGQQIQTLRQEGKREEADAIQFNDTGVCLLCQELCESLHHLCQSLSALPSRGE